MITGFEYVILLIGLGVSILWAVAVAIVQLFRNR